MTGEPTELAIAVAATSPLPMLQVLGELDTATAPQLRRRLDPFVSCSTGDVCVDLADVPFVDAAGLRVLVDAQRRLQSVGRRLTITPASTATLRVVQLAGVASLFDVGAPAEDPTTD